MTCALCLGVHEAVCPYSREEAAAIRASRTSERHASGAPLSPPVRSPSAPQTSSDPAPLPSGSRDAEHARGESTALPLAAAQRRRGKPGPKPGASRTARYRRRHPEYVARERQRLDALTRKQRGNA